jgi:membrane fusion protein, adhesin transport system
MLNISKEQIPESEFYDNLKSVKIVESRIPKKVLLKILFYTFLFFFVLLFIPWTQNVRNRGFVTALKPEHRPQTIQSIIDGRIEKWFVQEGELVKKGDTIVYISEIKDAYFDPQLLERTTQQIQAKENTAKSYEKKIDALENQIDALKKTGALQLEQVKNRLKQAELKYLSDSIDFEAAKINFSIAEKQFKRFKELYEKDIKSLTDLENRQNVFQQALARKIAAENNLLASQNDILNAKVEVVSIQAQFRNAIAKAESDRFSTMSNLYDTEAVVAKLQNEYMNYSVRMGLYYVLAPTDGFITEAYSTGIGENIKQGEQIISLMPANYELAVAMYVKPLDLPLIEKGQPVRIQFDGWPAIVFSGWPNTSYGTYGGRVFAIDNFISENGLYRVLVAPDKEDYPWPDGLRPGSGSSNMLLLRDVPIWYEVWRQINGFPPDYYKSYTKQDFKKPKRR